MNWDTDILIKLKRYAVGELQGKERDELEALLLKNADLREELEMTKALISATEAAEKERLINLIEKINAEKIEENIPEKNKDNIVPLNPMYKKLVWAAGIAAIAAICFWLFFPFSDPLDNFSQTTYIKPAIVGASLRGESQNKLSNAHREYLLNNFSKSNELLSGIEPSDSLYLYSLLLQGHNHFRSGNFDAAISTFDQLIARADPKGPYYRLNIDNAGWTRILAIFSKYKKEQDPDLKTELLNAINTFKQRADESDVYFEKAVLLEKLLAGN